MFFHQDATFQNLSIHRVGNRAQDEFYILSEQPIDLSQSEDLPPLLMQYFMHPFAKIKEVYNFYHASGDLILNEVFALTKRFFEGRVEFHQYSESIAKFLYEVSNRPKIRGGELYIVELNNVQIEGEEHNAIGIFKSESKEPFIKIEPIHGNFQIGYDRNGINIDKLDKGVIIINSEVECGYKVLVTESKNIQDSVSWKDDFLNIIARNDSYQQTANLLWVAKEFVSGKLDEIYEIEPAAKVELLNKTIKYFKENETFELEEFKEEIFGDEQTSQLFSEFKENFESEYESEIPETFQINDYATKKAQSSFKKVIKLDKNFKVEITGKSDYIEKGYDEEKGMNYYKLYFESET
ncbi:nucleoid-associated protein [Sphingobacterium sp.]|uniref:nucleoid-associated protein n=1 Tax=Sphingobacterium sp. TaxID=341027 RepID=UPI00289E2CD4|nr:nucleoid-associated protein [Sphingobacterium sp.]